MLLGKRNTDAGHILENVVYLELLRRGYDVYVGKVDSFEVDFVAMNGNNTFYYQVALSVRDADTLQRELRPLLSIRDHYPKYILTMDDDPEEQYDGIRRINARDWAGSYRLTCCNIGAAVTRAFLFLFFAVRRGHGGLR